MPTLGADELEAFCISCADCRDVKRLRQICKCELRSLIQHSALLIAVAQIEFDTIKIIHHISMDHPIEENSLGLHNMDIAERKAIRCWLAANEPLILDESDKRLSDLERQEIREFKLGKIGIHGFVSCDLRSGVYLSFSGLSDDDAANHNRLSVIAPPLSYAVIAATRVLNTPTSLCLLTNSEREIVKLAAQGRSNSEIAKLRGRSLATVRNQMHAAFVKLGVTTRT